MELLWAPWRMDYILASRKERRCIFCPLDGQTDEQRLILYRSPLALVMLNRYPFSYGHLMVAPIRHIKDLSRLEPEEMTEIFQKLGQSINILKEAFHPNGFNVGMNLGRVAGAGILHHLHFHIIPRWKGDNNFMPTVAEIRIIPEHLRHTYGKILPYFEKLKNQGEKP